jgi:hypothetical protein
LSQPTAYRTLATFDFKTGSAIELAAGDFVAWWVAPDYKYFYLTTAEAERKAQRLRFADRPVETITNLKDL